MNKLLLLTLLLLFTLSCCNTNEPPPPPIPPEAYEPLIPLKHGNYWLYQQYDNLDSTGNGGTKDIFGEFGFIVDSTYSYIYENKEITAYRMFLCGEELEPLNWGLDFYGSKLLYNDRYGVNYAGIEKNDTLKLACDDLIFSAKAEKGDTIYGHLFYYWLSNNDPNLPEDYTPPYTCISTDSVFTTPLGDFNCRVYRTNSWDLLHIARSESYYFIKPGLGIVGIVMMTYRYKEKKRHYFTKYILTSYKIN